MEELSQIKGNVEVSIIVPFYNAEVLLREALDSIAMQTFSSFEVILVDDGSIDSSSVIANKYAKEDKRFVYVWQENQGAGAARNTGMSLARGRYLLFLDADDTFEPNLVAELFSVAKKTDADVVECRADRFQSETGAILGYCDSGIIGLTAGLHGNNEYVNVLFQSFTYAPWDKLFKASFIRDRELEFQNLLYSNDNYFVLCALAEAATIYMMDDVLVHHRIGTGSSLRDNMGKNPYCDLLSFEAIYDRLQKQGMMFGALRTSFREACATVVVSSSIRLAKQSPDAMRAFCSELFSKYDAKWGIDSLSYKDVYSRKALWKYRRLRSSSPEGFLWACKNRSSDRSLDMKRGVAKQAFFAVRLLLASVFTRSMARK